MKHITYLLLITLLLVGLFISCQTEEVSPPPVVSELKAYPGKYRVKVEFQAPKESKSGKVFYGNGKFNEFTIDHTETTQTLIVEELTEGEQIIRVVTFNDEGISSDPKGTKVTIYGNSFQSDLTNRMLVTQRTISPTSIEMIFGDKIRDEEVGVRIRFKNSSGEQDSVMMNSANNSIIIDNIDLSEIYYFCSVYKPSTDFIDEYVTSPINAKEAAMKKFEKEIWKITGSSDEGSGSNSGYIIDNDASTVWYSQNNSSPHWIKVDMQSEKIFEGFLFLQTEELTNTSFTKGFRLETSSDDENWEVAWEGNLKANSYRQKITFQERAVARYFKITVLNGYNSTTPSPIAEIDLFNELETSGTNGQALPALENAKFPFEGDGSDLFPAVGANRMQKVTKWIHNSNTYISFDSGNFCVWSAAVWGVSLVSNGKIYQTLYFLPGSYVLNIDAGHTTNPACVDMYGIVAKGTTLPDYNTVTSATEVLGYSDLVAKQLSINSIPFTIEKASDITIGVVYNTHSIYEATGIPWSDMFIKGFELSTK